MACFKLKWKRARLTSASAGRKSKSLDLCRRFSSLEHDACACQLACPAFWLQCGLELAMLKAWWLAGLAQRACSQHLLSTVHSVLARTLAKPITQLIVAASLVLCLLCCGSFWHTAARCCAAPLRASHSSQRQAKASSCHDSARLLAVLLSRPARHCQQAQ